MPHARPFLEEAQAETDRIAAEMGISPAPRLVDVLVDVEAGEEWDEWRDYLARQVCAAFDVDLIAVAAAVAPPNPKRAPTRRQ